jgi:hypothetical protein
VLGFYLRLEDMSSPQSETEWINLSIGLSYTPPRWAWGYGRVELGNCGTIPASRIEGISGGEVERDHLLSVCHPCGHTWAFHSFGADPFMRGIVLRVGCRMGP